MFYSIYFRFILRKVKEMTITELKNSLPEYKEKLDKLARYL